MAAVTQLFALQGVIDIVTGKSERQLKAIDKQAKEVAESGGRAADKIALLGNSLLELGKIAAVLAPFAAATKLAAEFDKAMRNVNSVLKLSEPGFREFSERIRTLGAELRVSSGPAETAAAAYDIVSSGFTNAADATKILSASLIAASAGLTDAKTATAGITAALNAYSLGANDAQRISDVMFKTVDQGVTTFPELSQSMGQTLAIAASAGVSFEELMGTISVLTQRGFKTDMAFTAMRSAISKLIAPTEEQRKVMDQYGIVLDENTIKTKGIVQVLRDMHVATGGSKEAMSRLIGDIQGVAGAMSLMQDGGEAAERAITGMGNAGGSSMNAFNEQSKAAANQWEVFKTQIETAAVALGQTFLPAVNEVIKGMIALVEQFNKLPAPVVEAIALFGAMAATGFVVQKGMTLAVTAFTALSTASAAAGTGAAAAGVGFAGMAAALPVALIVAAGVGLKLYGDHLNNVAAAADKVVMQEAKMAGWLTANRKLWNANAEEVRKYGGSLAEVQFIAGLVHARQMAENRKQAAETRLSWGTLSAEKTAQAKEEIRLADVQIQKNAEQIEHHRKQLPEVQKLEAAEKKAADETTKANAKAAQASSKAWERFKADREAGIFATKDAELRALDATKKNMVKGTKDWEEMARARVQLQRQARDESLKTQEAIADGEADLARAMVTSAERVLQERRARGAATIADEQHVRDAAIAAADAELAAKTKKIDDEVTRHGGAAKLTADQAKLFAQQRTSAELAHVDAVASADARLAESRRAQKVQRMQDLSDLWAMEKNALAQELALLELRKTGGAKVGAEIAATRQAMVEADVNMQRVATNKELENASLTALQKASIIANGAAKERAIRTAAAAEEAQRQEQARQTRVAAELQMTNDVIRIVQGETVASKAEVDRQVKAWTDAGYDKVKIAKWAAAQAIAAERSIADEVFEIQQEILRMQGKSTEADLRDVEKRKKAWLDAGKDKVLIEAWATAKIADIHKNAAAGSSTLGGGVGSGPDLTGGGVSGGASASGSNAGTSTSFGSFDLSGGHRMAGGGAPSSLTFGTGGSNNPGGPAVDASLWTQTPALKYAQDQKTRSDKWADARFQANLEGRGVESLIGIGGTPADLAGRQAAGMAAAGASTPKVGATSMEVKHTVDLKMNLDGTVNVQGGPLRDSTARAVIDDIGLQSHILGDRPQGLGRTR